MFVGGKEKGGVKRTSSAAPLHSRERGRRLSSQLRDQLPWTQITPRDPAPTSAELQPLTAAPPHTPCFPKGLTSRSAGSLPTPPSCSQLCVSQESRGGAAAEALQGGRKGGWRKLPGRPQLRSRRSRRREGVTDKRGGGAVYTGEARCLPTFCPPPF